MSRSNRAVVWFAVFATLLAASAMPVGALQTNTALGSIHTNETDFDNATTLSNVTVQGSGEAANVTYGVGVIDDFEDQNLDEYTGDTSGYSFNTTETIEGSASLEKTGAGTLEIFSTSGLARYPTQGTNFSARIRLKNTGSNARINFGVQDANNFYSIGYVSADSTLRIRKISGGSTTDLATESVTPPAKEWLWFNGSWRGDGEIIATIADESGTTLATTSATDTAFVDGGIGLRGASSTGQLYDDYQITEVLNSGTYVSQTHSVDNAVTGFTNLTTVTDVEAHVTWLADTNGDGTFETTAATNTYTTPGNKTLDISGTDSTDWRVNVTFVSTGGNPSADLADEGILFTNHEPEVDNSSASPTGQLSQATQTLSIDISDTEFGTAQGDSVTVEFFVDNVSVGTDTLNSNGTAQLSHTFDSGTHTWNVSASDSYGLTNVSQYFTVSTPANLTIREEVPPHDIVTNADAMVIFYETVDDNPTIVNRSATNGNISMVGLPTTTEFAVRVSSPGYYNRTVLIDDIFTQSNIFLLPSDKSASAITYSIEDETGQFTGEDASITVLRAINQSKYNSGGYAWLTIAGDQTGAANELTVTLQNEVRYRLRVDDGAGDVRVVGAYTVVAPDSVVLRPSAPSINVTDIDTWEWNATQTNESGTETITFEFADPDSATTEMTVQIYEQGNKTNRFANQTIAGPITFTRITQTLTADQADTNWVVEFNATRNGETISDKTVLSKGTIEQLTELAPWIRHAIAALVIILTAGLFSLVNVEAGAVVTSFVGGGFVYVGWLPIAAGAAVAVALFVALFWKAANQRLG